MSTNKIELQDLGSMLRQITYQYGIPSYKYIALAKAINYEFDTEVTSKQIKEYDNLHIQNIGDGIVNKLKEIWYSE